jgi:hypothetical protein
MKYLENAIKFSIKNWMLILPLFVLTALANLLGGAGRSAMDIGKIWSTFGSLSNIGNPGDTLSLLPDLFTNVAAGSGIWAFLIQFVSIPATYGLVNKSLETGTATLSDIGAAISENFVKYLMYFVGILVVGLTIGIGSLILVLILSLLVALLKGVGVALMIIVMLALFVALIVFGILISMWLSAMITDGLDVVAAAKKSIEIVKSSFWTVVGVTILVNIAIYIAGAILGLLSRIPLLGPIIYSAVPTAQLFIMIVFLMTLYRERTGKINTL